MKMSIVILEHKRRYMEMPIPIAKKLGFDKNCPKRIAPPFIKDGKIWRRFPCCDNCGSKDRYCWIYKPEKIVCVKIVPDGWVEHFD